MKERLLVWLKKAERFTHTDNIYLAKNLWYSIATHVLGVLNGFILYLLIGYFLPKEVYGEYKYFLSLLGIFAIASLTGMEPSLTRSVAHGYEGSVRVAFRKKLLFGFLGSAVSVLAIGYYLWQGQPQISIVITLIALLGPFMYAANTYSAFLNGKKEFRLYAKIRILTSLASFVGLGLGVLFIRNSLLLFAVFLLTSLTEVFGYLAAKRHRQNDRVDPDLVPFAKHLSLLDVLAIVATRIDSILVFHFLGAASLAIYSLAIVPANQIRGLFKTLHAVAMPKFAINTMENLQRTMKRRLFAFCLVVAAAIGLYIGLAPLFFQIFFPRYLDSIPYSQAYSLSLLFWIPTSLLIVLFQAKGLRKETTGYSVTNHVLQIILVIVGGWLYGIWGIIGAQVITRAVMFVVSYIMLQHARITKIEPLAPTQSLDGSL